MGEDAQANPHYSMPFSLDELAAGIRRERVRRGRWMLLFNSLTVSVAVAPLLHDVAYRHSVKLGAPAVVLGGGILLLVTGWSLVRPTLLAYLAIGGVWFFTSMLWLLVGLGMLPYHAVLSWLVALLSLCVLGAMTALLLWAGRMHERTPAQEYVAGLRKRLWARRMSLRSDCVSFLVTRSGGYYRVLLLPDMVFFSSIEYAPTRFVPRNEVEFSAVRKTLFGRVRADVRFGSFKARVSMCSRCAERLRKWLELPAAVR